MLESIYLLIFFVLKEQKKINKAVRETESFTCRLKVIKATFECFTFLRTRIISIYRKLEQQQKVIMIAMNKLGKCNILVQFK